MFKNLVAFLAWLPVAGMAVAADDLRLATPEGAVVVEGGLIAVDGDFYRIETEFGAVTVDGSGLVCSGAGCPRGDAAMIASSISGAPMLLKGLVAPLMEGFAEARGLSFAEAQGTGGIVTWTLSKDETDVARISAGPALRAPDLMVLKTVDEATILADVIALDALVAVVAPDNPVATVSTPTLRLLLEGRVDVWPTSLTGRRESRPVTLHLPAGIEIIGRIWPYSRLRPAADATIYGDLDDLARSVAADPGALGLMPLSRIGDTAPLVLAGPCGRVLPATPLRIKAEDYPLTEPVYLQRVSPLQPRLMLDFIAYAQSEAAQPIIRRTGLIDQTIAQIPFAAQGDRLAGAVLAAGDDGAALAEMRRMIRALAAGARLTLTFRFEDGEATLDAPSRSNIRQLADVILAGQFNGRELLFAGFTDSQGPADANVRLSRRRAESVHDAVARLVGDVPVAMVTDGFGEALPMACDETHWGREVNRRVEVWLRDVPSASLE